MLLLNILLPSHWSEATNDPVSLSSFHDTSMLLRFGNNAKLRKDYCNVTPVVMYLRWVAIDMVPYFSCSQLSPPSGP